MYTLNQFLPDCSGFFTRNYERIDFFFVLLQRLLLSLQVLCGFEIRSPHGVEDGSNFFVKNVVRVSRNYYLILKDFRNRLAENYSSGRIATPEIYNPSKSTDTKYSSPASTSEPPPECDESAIKRCSIGHSYPESMEVARFEPMSISTVARKMVVGLVGVIPEPHSFTVLAGLIPLKEDDDAFHSVVNSPVDKTSGANTTMYGDIQDDASSVKEIEGDQVERPMVRTALKVGKGRKKMELKPKFAENIDTFHHDRSVEGDLKSANARAGTPHPKRSTKKSRRVLDKTAQHLGATLEEEEIRSPRSNDLSSFFDEPEEEPRACTM
uniref:Uncharacterized protein n=1 Tax=Bursaphelenchus xylophilus TaxID=6326 RepID=A0A1I7SE89_BURXY